jgi:hypothetical protein
MEKNDVKEQEVQSAVSQESRDKGQPKLSEKSLLKAGSIKMILSDKQTRETCVVGEAGIF